MKKFAVILAMLILPVLSYTQEKVYTKKMKLADFPQTTTRVVLGNDSASTALQEQISRRWIFSPFEFCSPESYEACKNSGNYCFIRLDKREGFLFLVLSKGGDENDENPLEQGFEIVAFPIAASEGPYDEAVVYMAGYVDMLQRFITDAIQSDRTAYLGLKAYLKPKGKTAVLTGKEALAAFEREQEGCLVEISVAPSDPREKSEVWHYLMEAGQQHQLYRMFRTRWKNK